MRLNMENFMIIKGSLHLIKIIVMLIIWLHCYACGWWAIIETSKVWFYDKIYEDFLRKDELYESSAAKKYLTSLQTGVLINLG